ncbi:MAG: class I SAM-dependent methyltransferase [Patescibacteria group bacterium]
MNEIGEDISQADIDTERLDGFSSGKYHQSFGKLAERPHQRRYLENAYKRSLGLVQEAGWENPIAQPDAEVLLCGTGSTETSSTFVRTIRDLNHDAKIHILDREQFPLDRSRERLGRELGEQMDGIEFHQEDALHTSFADSEISAIETDLFLQFFPPDAKAELLKEWWRILKPGGIVTTRDFVQSTGGRFEKRIANLQQRAVARAVHVPVYPTTNDELSKQFEQAGFDVRIIRGKVPVLKTQAPLYSYIIAHKPEASPIE